MHELGVDLGAGLLLRAADREDDGRGHAPRRQGCRGAAAAIHPPAQRGSVRGVSGNATCSPTSSGCAARWTSSSATSSTAACARGAVAASRRPSTSTTSAIRRGRSCAPTSPASTPPTSTLEIRGRELVLAGRRAPEDRPRARLPAARDRARAVPPRRRARRRGRRRTPPARAYEDGMLVVELPARPPQPARSTVPIEPERRASRDRLVEARRSERPPSVEGRSVAAGDAARAAAARHGHLPRHADAAGGRPGALDLARQRRARRRPPAGDGRQPRPRRRRRPARSSSTTSASPAPSRACSRCPTARCGSSCRAASGCASRSGTSREPYLVARISELPDDRRRRARSSRR